MWVEDCVNCFDDDDFDDNALIGWIGCSKCNKWFHSTCVTILESEENFVCEYCV